jgi:hypothetical protein
MVHITFLVHLVSTVSGHHKNALGDQVLLAGTKQNLSNLLFFLGVVVSSLLNHRYL